MSLNQKMTLVFPNWLKFLRYSIFLFQKSAKNKQILTLVFYNFDEAVSVFSSMFVEYFFIFDAIP